MNEFQKLVVLLKELEKQLTGCRRCGLCQSVRPLFAQTLDEADVARGKLSLIDGLTSEMLRDVSGVRQRLDKCLLCGSCAANCPSGVSALEIFFYTS
jgi:glycolate oxidase iron-sulfur subunit